MRSPTGSETGFTLIEVLVALTILSLSFAVLLTMISRGLEASRRSQLVAGATGLAQSLLAEIGVSAPIRIGTTTGTSSAYRWEIDTAPYLQDNRTSAPFSAAKVTIRVTWIDGGNQENIDLSTLRLIPKIDR